MPAAARTPPAGDRRLLLAVLFAVYLVLLVWVVLWKLEVPFLGTDDQRRLKLTPFAAGGGVGANTPVELGINVLLFLPFGIYLGLLADRWPWWKAAGIVAGTSLLFEVTQYVLAIGVADVTDIIVNTTGGLAGLGVLVWARCAGLGTARFAGEDDGGPGADLRVGNGARRARCRHLRRVSPGLRTAEARGRRLAPANYAGLPNRRMTSPRWPTAKGSKRSSGPPAAVPDRSAWPLR